MCATYSVGLLFLTFTPFGFCASQIFADVIVRAMPSRSNVRWVPRLTLPCQFNTVPITFQFPLCFSLTSFPISSIFLLLSYFVSHIFGARICSPTICTSGIYFPCVLLHINCGVSTEIDNYSTLFYFGVL